MPIDLSKPQLDLIRRPAEGRIFLEGPAGAGKTTAAVERVLSMLGRGIDAGSVLVLVPQRTLGLPFEEALRAGSLPPGGRVTVSTVGGLARRLVRLYWPLVAEEAGFRQPDREPTFLTIETAQYYMARLVGPLLDQGYFDTINIGRNRIYGQILDNLNKAAVVGFDHGEIGERLKEAWAGEEVQKRIYDDAQACASLFREHCLAHNLLDFSLQLEVFLSRVWPLSLCRTRLLETYTHLIVDNPEEDTPAAHGLLREWLPSSGSALIVSDRDAGYRLFLGADAAGVAGIAELCGERVTFADSFVTSPELQALATGVAWALGADAQPSPEPSDPRGAIVVEAQRYYPQMLDWAAGEIARLVHEESVPPGEIAVLAPFLTDSLRFSLRRRLAAHEVPVRSHRPSRALREEPAAQCVLTLAGLAHPDWGRAPTLLKAAQALMLAIEGLDLARSHLLSKAVYSARKGAPGLIPFDQISRELQERITYALGERYERIRSWLEEYGAGVDDQLDHFLSRLFGEVLSQAGFGFHSDYDAGQVVANLIESVRKFRWVTGEDRFDAKPLGQEYIEMVQAGVVAAQYVGSWRVQPEEAVLLAPAYTFLMTNRPVDYQFWVDVGSRGWWERLHQPLTHPYVLSKRWTRGARWTDADEEKSRREAVSRLTLGLIRRCRRKVYLPLSELGEQGYEQKGPLLRAVQRMLGRFRAKGDVPLV
jgi:hypothetical protein